MLLFKGRLPGDLYNIASKANLQEGIEICRHGSIVATAWNTDKTSLSITFSSLATTTLTGNGLRILTGCSCRLWRPGLQCPHVVAAWAVCKRLASPESLFQIRFNPNLLEKTALLSGLDLPPEKNTPLSGNKPQPTRYEAILRKVEAIANRETRQSELPGTKTYRLVISQQHNNRLDAGIYRGRDEVYRWSSHSAPAGIQRFMMSNNYFDGSSRYFEQYLACTGGKHPIVFRAENGQETPLAWRSDLPLKRTLALAIRDEEVHLTRTLDKGMPIPNQALHRDEVLVNRETGVIHPLLDQKAWKIYDQLEEQLYNAADQSDDDDFDDELHDDYEDTADITSLPHGIAVGIEQFNKTAIRLLPEALQTADSGLLFFCNNILIKPANPEETRCLLNISTLAENAQAYLTPLVRYRNLLIPFSNSTFYFFRSNGRSHFPAPLRAKKRIRHLIETFFQLINEKKPAQRTKMIRSALATPDFNKTDVKRAARLVLNTVVAQASYKPLLLNAAPDGWHFAEDDRMAQAQLVRIMFDLFGSEVFNESIVPAGAELPAALFMQQLPGLAKKLEENGFELMVDLQPLTTGSWQFSLDATRSSLDWFELKPEIRVNGELLTEAELRELLGGSGMLRKDGKLLLLDELSAQVLAMFSSAMTARKSKKGKAEPVRVPRLQILDWLQLRKHGVDVQLAPQDAEILDSLLNFEQLPKPPLPHGLVAELRHYQQDAWHWLAFLYRHRFGACLADDMGLGKTLQGITLMAGIMAGALPSAASPGSPHLVVAPPSLLFNWEAEIARFLPSARVLLYAGTGRSLDQFHNHDIIITSYGIVQRDHEKLEQLHFDVLIFDETQVVKNLQAATTNAVRKLKGAFVLALTGTPVENHLGEYYAIMDLCLPGLLGSHDEFNRQIAREGLPATQRLVRRTKPFVLRRTKQLIASELPPKIETDIQLELSQKQKVLYQRTVEEVKGQVHEAYQNHAAAQARIIALTAILRLRQICLAPALAAASASDSSPKLDFLIEQLEELRDEGHSALVFSQFTGYLDIIERGLKQQGLACLRLDGSTPVPQRKKLVQTFQSSTEPLVFLISLKAGGKGLNLTRATYVYHMDPWWNPAVENQASDRAHRIGQTEQVTITRLIMRHTIEEKMMALKSRKLELYKALLEDGTGGGGSGLTREDFDFLLG